jgi:hypothetical protein
VVYPVLVQKKPVATLGGQFTASNFSFTASAGAPLSASQITVTPNVTTVGGVAVLVDLNFAADFNNTTGSPIDYSIDYTLDPLAPVINGATIGLDPGGVLTEQICAGGVFSGSTCTPGTAFGSTLVATTLLPNSSTAFPTSVSTVDYQLLLDLPPGMSAGGFDSGSVTGLGETAPVPEPSSALLAGCGSLGLLALRSRAKLRKITLHLLSRVSS